MSPSSSVLELLQEIPTPSGPYPTGDSLSFQPLQTVGAQGELGFVGYMEKK